MRSETRGDILPKSISIAMNDSFNMITGIIPAVVLPMNKSAEPDLDEYKRYLKWVTSAGVTGAAVNVDTGEGPNLTPEERREVVKVARASVGGKLVVAGIIGSSTKSAVARQLKPSGLAQTQV